MQKTVSCLFLIGNLLSLSTLFAMEHSAQTVAQPHTLVMLKNGATASGQLAFDTHLSVSMALQNNRGSEIKELLEHCQNPEKAISPSAGEYLLKKGFLDANFKPHAHLKNIFLSMIKYDAKNNLRIQSPIKN